MLVLTYGGNKMNKTTTEEKMKIVEEYLQGMSSIQIGGRYDISHNAVCGLLKRRGVKIRPLSESMRKYSLDETFFDIIDTQEKAYFLGLLYADGYNNEERGVIALRLSEGDKDILLKFNKAIQSNRPLQYIKTKKATWFNVYGVHISNKHMSDALKNLGCTQRKSLSIIIPNINKKLMNHFIRGYYDGDGSMYIGKGKARNNKQITITGATSFCKQLGVLLKKELKINSSFYHRYSENKKHVTLSINGTRQVGLMQEWLYKGAEGLYLERKYTQD
jgi:hypothetical protein